MFTTTSNNNDDNVIAFVHFTIGRGSGIVVMPTGFRFEQ